MIQFNHRTQSNTVRMQAEAVLLRYLVVPHADIGPDIIIDYRLLFIFRLQRQKNQKLRDIKCEEEHFLKNVQPPLRRQRSRDAESAARRS